MRICVVSLKIMLIFLALIGSGCLAFQQVDQKTVLENSLRAYMQKLRWQDYHAAAAFMAKENRAAFLEDFTGNDALNMTDVTLLNFEPAAHPNEYQTLIRMEYFILPSNTVQTKDVQQTWVLILDPASLKPKGWRIASPFPDFP